MLKPLHNLVISFKSPRIRWALAVAMVSDALGFGVVMFPLLQWLFDAVTALVLLAILGFRWQLFTALAVEVVPALELFPAWSFFVLAIAAANSPRSR